MKVSLNTVKRYTEVDLGTDALVTKINGQLGGVEKVIELGQKYAGARIVKVVSCEDHPNADRLHVCKIDDGGFAQSIERDADGLVQVVCGAPNARAGMWAVWLPPTATVPASYDEAEPFVLDARPLRGVLSNGMLASPKELSLGDGHEGILEINPEESMPSGVDITAGASFADVFGLNDTIIDIENKMFTHRPDLFGQLGVAREIAGINHRQFNSPEWYTNVPQFDVAEELEFSAALEAPEKAARFMTVVLKDVTIAPSPVWLQAELVRLGSKPINNIVDATNYVMLLTAQPTHAYDYAKLRDHRLSVRMAKAGESATLLNGKTYQFGPEDIIIADGVGPVGLAGIMGGGESEVDPTTKDVVLEVATFDMYTVRKSSMRHGIFTDALSRFNKGQSPLQNDRVLALLMRLITEIAGGSQASPVSDLRAVSDDVMAKQSVHEPLMVATEFINERLGLRLEGNEIETLLRNVEFDVSRHEDTLQVTAPFWRTDIELPEDIVEEVGRLYGYDNLPAVLPRRSIVPASQSTVKRCVTTVRYALKNAGANEVLTYSFVREDILLAAGQDPEQAFSLSNALSPDLRYYRLSLTPSLASKVHMNSKAGFDEFALFEIGKAHARSAMDADALPEEWQNLAVVYAATDKVAAKKEGAAYYQAQRLLRHVAEQAGFSYELKPATEPAETEQLAFMLSSFDVDRSAEVIVDGKVVGYVGEYHNTIRQKLKVPAYAAGFELSLDALVASGRNDKSYVPLSRFPKVEQDVTFKVTDDTPYEVVARLLREALQTVESEEVTIDVRPLSIYKPEDETTKNISFRITCINYVRTMTDAEVTKHLVVAAQSLQDEIGAIQM